MVYTQRMLPQPLSSLAYGSIGSSYATLATISNPSRLIKIVNYTNAPIFVSWNGDATTDDDFVAENSFVLYDITANQSYSDRGEFIPAGTVFSIKYAVGAPTSGSVYLTAMYAEEV